MKKIKKLFYLDKEVIFLNHGSFGACSKPVIDVYRKWQIKLKWQPVEFLGRKHAELLLKSRKRLAAYAGSQNDELIFVANAGTAINIVSYSLNLSPKDEVISTNLEYGAMDRMWKIICERKNAKYIRANIDLPIVDDNSFVHNVWDYVNKKTKVISAAFIL